MTKRTAEKKSKKNKNKKATAKDGQVKSSAEKPKKAEQQPDKAIVINPDFLESRFPIEENIESFTGPEDNSLTFEELLKELNSRRYRKDELAELAARSLLISEALDAENIRLLGKNADLSGKLKGIKDSMRIEFTTKQKAEDTSKTELKKALKESEAKYQQLLEGSNLYDAIQEAMADYRIPEEFNIIRFDEDPEHPDAVLIVPVYDVHYGGKIKPEQVSFHNEFNSEICVQRIAKWASEVIQLHQNRQSEFNYKGIFVPIGGDLIENELHHPDSLLSSDRSPVMSVIEVSHFLAEALQVIQEVTGLPIVAEGIRGNHDRIDAKPTMTDVVERSYSTMVYANMREMLAQNSNIRINIPPAGESYTELMGHTYLCIHGDDLPASSGGTAITRHVGKMMLGSIRKNEQAVSINRPFDNLIFGHFHTKVALPGMYCSGSFPGFHPYPKRKLGAKAETPAQLAITATKYGVSKVEDIFLEKPSVERVLQTHDSGDIAWIRVNTQEEILRDQHARELANKKAIIRGVSSNGSAALIDALKRQRN